MKVLADLIENNSKEKTSDRFIKKQIMKNKYH